MQRVVRGILTVIMLGVAGLWLVSLPLPLFERWLPVMQRFDPATLNSAADGRILIFPQLTTPPNERDALVLILRVSDPAGGQRRGAVVWQQGNLQGRVPLTVRADGRLHRYTVAVGTYPLWRDTPTQVRMELRNVETVELHQAQLVRRGLWALDVPLGRGLVARLPEYPPWPNIVLLVAAAVAAVTAVLVPVATWRRRLAVVGVGLSLATALGALPTLLEPLRSPLAALRGLDDMEAAQFVPAYSDPATVNAVLVAAMGRLPAGPVLVLDANTDSYLVYRTRYLLYPRRVDVANERVNGAQRARLALQYDTLIQRGAVARPPAVNWIRQSANNPVVTIWSAPGLPPPPVAAAGVWALLRLVAVLIVIAWSGWALAGWLGWRGSARWIAAWLGGTTLATLLLFALTWSGIGWNAASIGLPLVAGLAVNGGWSWEQRRRARRVVPRLHSGSRPIRQSPSFVVTWLIVGLLAIGVSLYATALPFSDQDSWTTWGFKARAFFHDGALTPLLTMYPDLALIHPGYPNGQPLLLTGAFLAMGGTSEHWAKLIFPVWYVAAVGLVWSAARHWAGTRRAAAWTLLLAITPLMLDHATLGNADLPFAVALGMGGYALARWLDGEGRRFAWSGAGLLGAAAWLKLDGLYLGPALLVLAGGLKIFAQRTPHPAHRVIQMRAVATLVGCIVAFALPVLPWHIYVRTLGLVNETPGLAALRVSGLANLARGLVITLEEFLLSHNDSAWGPWGGGYGAFWLVCGGAVVAGWRSVWRDRTALFLALSCLGITAFYSAIYIVRPFFSIERYLLHLAPLAVLLAARVTRRVA